MSKKLTYEFIKNSFEKEGYELLDKEYKSCSQKLNYICPKGHIYGITWDNWKQGERCPYCSGKAKKTIEFIRSKFEEKGYKLLTTIYKNNTQKLDYICPKGHKHSISWNSWQRGSRCPYCSNKIKKTVVFIKSKFIKEGYVLLTKKYKNAFQKLDYICPKGHSRRITWCNWRQGKRCLECVGKISKGEIEVRNFVKSLNIKVLANDKNTIVSPITNYPLELDIFMPALNKAIEYNGEYWHQDENKDLLKQQLCKSKGIDLLTIWDKKWLNENKKCENEIKKFIFNKV